MITKIKASSKKLLNPIHISIASILEQEAQTILDAAKNLPQNSLDLVEELLHTKGRIVFSGIGKSGIVAKKLVATFSSLGKPSLFLHPSEALHGDLGMLRPEDLFIALSKSGTGNELEQVIYSLQNKGNRTALICCRSGNLTNLVHLSIQLPFKQEACSMNLAPTSSSTLMIAFGDALAVTVSQMMGFGKHDFARSHPAGALGKRLLLSVSSLMHKKDDLPLIFKNTPFKELLSVITSKKLGLAIVINSDQTLAGIITDGDLRRSYAFESQLFEKTANDLMSEKPHTISAETLAYNALQIMEQFNITCLVVTEADTVIGVIHIHDLVKAGIKP